MQPVFICGDDVRHRLDVFVGIARHVRIGDVGGSAFRCDVVHARVAAFKGGFEGGDLRPVSRKLFHLHLFGELADGRCGGLDPLVLRALVVRVFKLAHPAFRFFRTAPVVHQDPARRGRERVLLRRFHLIDGLAVHKPDDVIFRPAIAVVVEILARVKAEVDLLFMASHAVHIVVELYLRGVVAQKFDVYFVPGIGIAVFVQVVIARAGKEGAAGAVFARRFHADFKVAVPEILIGASLAAEIAVVRLHRAVGIFGDAQVHGAVLIGDVVVFPESVEHVLVGPAVGREHGLRLPLAEIGKHGAVQRFIRQFLRASGQHCRR